MRKFGFIFVVLAVVSGVHAGEVLDRIVVTVNGNALLQSDWDVELDYESFMSGHRVDEITPQDRESALNRIIDQELLREQIRPSDLRPVSAANVEIQLDLLKEEYQRDHEGQSWTASLDGFGISEAEIRAHIQAELNQLRAIDVRLRPSVQVDATAVQSYYKEKIVTQSGGKQPVTFAEAEPKIREILAQEQINQLLDSWLQSLRSQAKIQRFGSESSAQAHQP
jgi:hypothetical protein